MIKYYLGTVFNAGTDAIVNTVNCTGVMGAGLAFEFMLRYPEMYKDYVEKCERKEFSIGKVEYFEDVSGEIIVNFPTKWHFKYPSKIEWIESGLKDFVRTYKKYPFKSIAFPKLGTLNGGLNWDDVKVLMEAYLGELNIDVFICLDELKEAEGVEKKMLESFNCKTIKELGEIAKITTKQKNLLEEHMPFERFWHISKIQGIGKKTYSSFFTFFYEEVTSPNSEKQLQFF